MRYDTGGNRKKPERRASKEPEQRRAAKQQMLELIEAGVSWQEAATTAGVQRQVKYLNTMVEQDHRAHQTMRQTGTGLRFDGERVANRCRG